MNICMVKKSGSTKLIIAKGSKSSRGAAAAYLCYIHKKNHVSVLWCFAQCLAAQIIRFLNFAIFFFQLQQAFVAIFQLLNFTSAIQIFL